MDFSDKSYPSHEYMEPDEYGKRRRTKKRAGTACGGRAKP
jgi:hypothetical protein